MTNSKFKIMSNIVSFLKHLSAYQANLYFEVIVHNIKTQGEKMDKEKTTNPLKMGLDNKLDNIGPFPLSLLRVITFSTFSLEMIELLYCIDQIDIITWKRKSLKVSYRQCRLIALFLLLV